MRFKVFRERAVVFYTSRQKVTLVEDLLIASRGVRLIRQ